LTVDRSRRIAAQKHGDGLAWTTRLAQPGDLAPAGFRSLVAPVHRGSTTVFPNAASVQDTWDQQKAAYTYGQYGTPTALELGARIAELEHGSWTFLTPGGQAALSLVDLTFLAAGDHVLLPESIYGPSRELADGLLRRLGIEATYYPPTVGAGIGDHLLPTTKLVWTESPGSNTMEVQDVPAIAKAAHAHGAIVALDNTWSAGVLFDAFAHGVDVSVQALTKYIGGHSDLLLGAVTVNDQAAYERVGQTLYELGSVVSPDDCSLALRGLQTLAVRLAAIERSALEVARWLAERPEIELVLHPALPDCPGHEFWKRDFTGSSGTFSIVLAKRYGRDGIHRFIDALRLFRIGYSWGGVTSLVVPRGGETGPPDPRYGHRLVRLSIGLEDVRDLIADLQQALASVA
jgi:cysteine-S-conjugate beta-lyase